MNNNFSVIPVKKHYLYFPIYNTIINKELAGAFKKYSGVNHLIEVCIDERTIEKNIINIDQIVFETTEDCNLRCKYCIFSEYYPYYRVLSKNSLTYDVAEKGLLKIHELINKREKKELNIGFYGGEPLLKFDLICKDSSGIGNFLNK